MSRGIASIEIYGFDGGMVRASPANPCINCGACCASFRVQFYWREANREDNSPAVPSGFFSELTPLLRCMRGTDDKHHPKCAGLTGRIGVNARCSIYDARPTPCRAFQASYFEGRPNPRCDEARRKHGLRPLRLEDWDISSPDEVVEREGI